MNQFNPIHAFHVHIISYGGFLNWGSPQIIQVMNDHFTIFQTMVFLVDPPIFQETSRSAFHSCSCISCGPQGCSSSSHNPRVFPALPLRLSPPGAFAWLWRQQRRAAWSHGAPNHGNSAGNCQGVAGCPPKKRGWCKCSLFLGSMKHLAETETSNMLWSQLTWLAISFICQWCTRQPSITPSSKKSIK